MDRRVGVVGAFGGAARFRPALEQSGAMGDASGAHKLKLLDDFVSMYACRVQVAIDEFQSRFERVAVVSTVGRHGKIVPDMTMEYMSREQLLARANRSLPGIGGAMALFDRDAEEGIPIGLIFDDGDIILSLVTTRVAAG